MFLKKPKIKVSEVLNKLYIDAEKHPYVDGLKQALDIVEDEYESFLSDLDSNPNMPLKCDKFEVSGESGVKSTITKEQMLNYYKRLRGDRWEIFEEYFYPMGVKICPYCGVTDSSTLDHILPKDEYIKHCILPSNLVRSCNICNGKKSTFVPSENLYYPYKELPLYNDLSVNQVSVSKDGIKPSLTIDNNKFEVYIEKLNLKNRIPKIVQGELTTIIYTLHMRSYGIEDILKELKGHTVFTLNRKYMVETISELDGSVHDIGEVIKGLSSNEN